MKYLLDSDVCIGIMREKSPKAASRLHEQEAADVCLCSIVRFELLFGAEHCDRPAEEFEKVLGFSQQFNSLKFDDESAAEAASIREFLESRGTKIGPYDIQIAAIARQHNLTLVTRNMNEFRRVPGIRIENWDA